MAKFEGEVSCLTFKTAIERFGKIGREDGLFVMPKSEMDNLLIKTRANISEIEKELGIPEDMWRNRLINSPQEKFLRVDIKMNAKSRLRVPSGNELGADEWLWVPGGKTIKGVSEAIIEPIDEIETSIYKTKIIIE